MAHKRWHTDSLQYKYIHYRWNIITHYSYCITLPCCCTNCKECTFRQHFCRVPSSTQPVLAACVSAKVIMRLKVASRSPQKSFFEKFSLWRSWSCWCLPNLPKIWTQCSLNTSLFGWFTKRNVRWRPRSIRALGIASVLGVFSPSPPLSPSPPSPPQVKYLLNRMSGPSVWPQLPGFCCMRWWAEVIMRVGGPLLLGSLWSMHKNTKDKKYKIQKDKNTKDKKIQKITTQVIMRVGGNLLLGNLWSMDKNVGCWVLLNIGYCISDINNCIVCQYHTQCLFTVW